MTTEEIRFMWLRKLFAGNTQKEFAKLHGMNESYLSQMMTGVKSFSERAAKNMEARMGLVPGTLVHPKDPALLESTSLSSLYLNTALEGQQASGRISTPIRTAKGTFITETDVRRIEILRAIIGDHTQLEFCDFYGISSNYLSQILNGFRCMGEKTVRKLEGNLNLVPGVLEHPMDVSFTTQNDIIALFKAPGYVIPSKPSKERGLRFLSRLSELVKSGVLADSHLAILEATAEQFAQQDPHSDRIQSLDLRTQSEDE